MVKIGEIKFQKILLETAILIVLFGLRPFGMQAQDNYEWWNMANQWDGYTHWTGYIVYSPYYMGPNALEVPFSEKGLVSNRAELKIDGAYHYSLGDKTQNMRVKLYYPLLKNKIAVELYGVPYENYQMNYETILIRRTRNINGKGTAKGDLYFATIIQLIRGKKFPDLALRMACRTASGTNLSDARYTDGPGYFFDLSGGKDIDINPEMDFKLRLHTMAGFYVWQMNLPNIRQDDAFLYGIGIDLDIKDWYLNNALEGYAGYFGNQKVIVGNQNQPVEFNDQPLVFRINAGRQFGNFKLSVAYHAGLNDFPYNSYILSFTYLFNAISFD